MEKENIFLRRRRKMEKEKGGNFGKMKIFGKQRRRKLETEKEEKI